MGWILVLLVVAGCLALLYRRARWYEWDGALALLWVAWFAGWPASRVAETIVLVAGVSVLVALQYPPLRRGWASARLFHWFRDNLPPVSRTEREALEAGTVWWEGELFSGAPRWGRLLDFPRPRLSEEDLAFLNGPVEELCRLVDDWEVTHERLDLPPEVWNHIREQRLWGMIIPRRYGGLELSAQVHSQAVMKIATRSITAAVTVMVPNSLGPAELLIRYGTEAQKEHYLPRLARGEEVPCFALTGPRAGSDASAIPDTGVICRGSHGGRDDVLGIRLNWEKRYITLGPVATVLGLAFHLYDPDGLLGGSEDLGITLALIPVSTPGIEIGRRHMPLNVPFQNGPNRGRDVFIPLDWVIGGREGVGEGWRMLMECLAAGRAISLPALSTGAGKLASRATGAYARIREQFHRPIGTFEGVQEALARIAGYAYQCDAARTLTAAAVDQGQQPAVASAIVKYSLTERMRRIVNHAMDIQGGAGICLGPRNFLGRVYQALPIAITVEGANILTRSMIVFGQGAIRCHPFVRGELEAAQDPDTDAGLRRFDRLLWSHVAFTLANAVRSLVLGLSGGRGTRVPAKGPAARYLQQLTRWSAAFALVSDLSMLALGGSLKRREMLSGRLADCLSNLYLASACVKRYHDQEYPAEDLPLLRWSCERAIADIQNALSGVLDNHPLRPLAVLMRLLVFPLGRRLGGPGDALDREVAGLLMRPSATRNRLTAGIHIPVAPDQRLAQIEDALARVVAAEPVERRLRALVREGRLEAAPADTLARRALEQGFIDAAAGQILAAAEAARLAVIEVDDFPPDFGLGTHDPGIRTELEVHHGQR